MKGKALNVSFSINFIGLKVVVIAVVVVIVVDVVVVS